MRCKRILRTFVLYSKSAKSGSNLLNCEKFSFILNRSMSTNIQSFEDSKIFLKDVFEAGITAVSPKTLIRTKVKYQNGKLHIADRSFDVTENVYLIGFGKAVMGMAIVLEQILGDSLKKGIVSVPTVSKAAIWESEDKTYFPKLKTGVIEYRAGSLNNQPDDRSLETTHDLIDLIEPLTEKDTLIVLISGGGSALLYMPRPIIDHEDKLQLCRALQNAGADIKELNTVRKKLSMVKGGGLARMAYPAPVISLILSDIVGDPIDLIASGPTVYSEKSPEDVVAILKKYDLYKGLEGDLKAVITSKETFDDKPLLNPGKEFKHVSNIILGNNTMAIEAASQEAYRKTVTPITLRNDVVGDVQDVSLAYVHVASLMCLALEKDLDRDEFYERVKNIPILSLPGSKVDEIYNLIENISGVGVVLIAGGEPTVVVKGQGKGGRNQELALHFSLDWLAKIKSYPQFSKYDVLMLSGGTDGQDGPTDAAGAYGYPAIGPIMHDLYSKIKSETTKAAHTDTKKDTPVEDEEKIQSECKVQELSGFLSLKKKQIEHSSSKVLHEGSASDAGSTNYTYEDIDPLILTTMEVERMLPENVLKNNDTYNFYSRFKKGADIVKTGFTGTNVMDLHFIYIRKRKCDCKIDYDGEHKSENTLDKHDLHIDPETIDKYKTLRTQLRFRTDRISYKPSIRVEDKAEHINIKIVDDNLQDPCCRKERKFPAKKFLKDTDFLIE